MTPRQQHVVLLTEAIHEDGIRLLRERVRVEMATSADPVVLCGEVIEADALIVRSTPLPGDVIAAGSRLRAIGRHGVGVDNIDVEAASAAGIAVVNTPTSNTESVAEFTIAVLLAMAKGLVAASTALKRPELWSRDESLPGQVVRLGFSGFDIAGQTLGLIGLGAIGREVATRAASLGMQVIAYDPFLSTDSMRRLGVDPVSNLEEILAGADYLSIHVPATNETAGLVGEAELAMMKPSAYLINTSRAGVVDEAALVAAVERRSLAGAAVDVFANEPPSADDPLLTCDRILATPHMAAMTVQALKRMALEVVDGVLAVLDGDMPPNTVNRDRLVAMRQEGAKG